MTTDQIGTPRPQGSACDIGAIEVKSLSTTNGTIDSGSYVLTADITLTGTLHITQGVVSIEGNGFAIDGNNTHRLFLVTNNAVLNLNQVTLRNGNGYGGSAILNFGQANVLNSLILNNNATYNGGAISNERGSMLFIGNTTISGNTAGSSGGAIYNRGGIFTVNSTFSNNSAGNSGGAIFNNINSTFTVTNSSFSNNAATSSEGGAIFNNTKGNIEIQNSTFSGNSAVNGGAIRNRGISTLTNNTISENSATSLGGAIANTNTMSIINNIISNNTSTSGNCYNSGGAIADSGGNLEDTNTCGLSSGFNTNPLLGAFNGSYYPLQASSPAIDAAPTCAGLFADQIGTSRPQGSACDIGAIEYIN
ncbi:MAG: hypothetical protein D6711_11235 [Chloroflexi bacterium]|nr:MAG: hypothetical protein D6711_11235 [Chloroflexota bacterium]